jgi:hypothetical protein
LKMRISTRGAVTGSAATGSVMLTKPIVW